MQKKVAFAVALVVVATALWSAWVLETKTQHEGSRSGEVFSFQLPEEKASEYGDVLIRCTEDRLDEPSEAFAKWLGLQGVPLELPGSTWALANLSNIEMTEAIKPLHRAAVEVLKRYAPRRVAVVAHDMCIFYDTEAAWTNRLQEVRQRQIGDVKSSLQMLREWFPNAEVSGYYAQTENSKLVFRPLDSKEK